MASATDSASTPRRPPSEREVLLDAEVSRLAKELTVLERQWASKHRLAAFAIFAIPALYFGAAYAVIILLCTPALIATQAYLIGVRRNECRELIRETGRELARLRSLGATG